MNRILASSIIATVLALTPAVSFAVNDAAVLTDDQVEYIRNNCTDTQTALKSLYATDAVARVNLGQQYEAVATRLMVPMNNRVLLNKLDGAELSKTTVEFNKELDNFRKALYPPYKNAITSLVGMNCYNQPIEFYDGVVEALAMRAGLRSSVEKLGKLLTQYRSQVAEVEKMTSTGGQG